MRDLFPVIVHTVLRRADAVLLLRRCGTGYLDGWYALPGGHLVRGEGIVDCAVRECREEVGVVLDRTHVRALAAMPYRSSGQQGIDFILTAAVFDGEPRIAEPDRCDDLGWWRADALPPRTVPYIARALSMWRRGEWFDEFDVDFPTA